MAYNAAGVYSLPAGSTITNGETSDASDLNIPLADLAAANNAARPITAGGTGATTAAGARANLGLVTGTNVQAYDAGLTSIAGLTTEADRMIYTTAMDTYAVTPLTAAARTVLDDTSVAAMRNTLGVGAGFVAAGTEVTDFDDVAANGLYWGGASASNMPGTANIHTLLHVFVNANLSTQIATDVSTNTIYKRTRIAGTWNAWADIRRDENGIGVSQTWQDVSGSRSDGTSYQNTTGKPIMVSVNSDQDGLLQVSTDNATWVTVGRFIDSSNDRTTCTTIVPNNHYYRTSGAAGFNMWVELR